MKAGNQSNAGAQCARPRTAAEPSTITLSIGANWPDNVRLVGACLRQLASLIFDQPQAAEVELAIVEALNNCIEHADIGNHRICLDVALKTDGISIDLTYLGKPIAPSQLDRAAAALRFDPSDIASLPETGRGIFIIKSLMDDVRYEHNQGRNLWQFTKRKLGSLQAHE